MEKFDGMRVGLEWPAGVSTKAGNRAGAGARLAGGDAAFDMWLDGELWANGSVFHHVDGDTINAKAATDEVLGESSSSPCTTRRIEVGAPARPAARCDPRAARSRAAIGLLAQLDVVEALPCRAAAPALARRSRSARTSSRKALPGFDAENPGCPAEFLTRVVKARGEGGVLRRVTPRGRRARSRKDREVLKVKLRYDHEAVVVGAMEKESLADRSVASRPCCKCDCRCSITCVRNKGLPLRKPRLHVSTCRGRR